MSGLIYSANIGGYDTPKAMPFGEDGAKCLLFGDTDAPGWDCAPFPEGLESSGDNNLYFARQLKVLMPVLMPGFDWYLWLDATMQPKKRLMPLVWLLIKSEHDFAAFKHNEWDCAYTEIDKCIDRKKDRGWILRDAKNLLEDRRFPKGYGQAATGVLFRKNTNTVRDHAIRWWSDMKKTTMRDQCTFMFNLWKLESGIEWIPGLHINNKWIQYRRGHKGAAVK